MCLKHPEHAPTNIGEPTWSISLDGDAAAPLPPVSPRPRCRPKLWELEAKLHCPIIGTCLPLSDLQRIAKRCHFAARPDDDFALHVEAVSHARSRNPASEAIQRHLDARYRLAVARFARFKTDAELREKSG